MIRFNKTASIDRFHEIETEGELIFNNSNKVPDILR